MLITKTSHITSNKILSNGHVVFSQEPANGFQDFIKAAFKELCAAYPKFYKMDSLCKLAFVASEVLLKDTNLTSTYPKDEIGLVFLNGTSTINTDKDHQRSIDDRGNYFPSPAVFVYTLPNIMLGEICIKNGFFGENALLISEKFESEVLYRQVSLLFENKRQQACIAGCADICNEHYEAFMMLIEPDSVFDNSKEMHTFAPVNIHKLYNR